jgi:hypothetical protein
MKYSILAAYNDLFFKDLLELFIQILQKQRS